MDEKVLCSSCNNLGTTQRYRNSLRARHIELQKGKCWWCGITMTRIASNEPTAATLEHLVRVADGGEDTFENTRAACRRCNNERQTRTLRERTEAAWESAARYASAPAVDVSEEHKQKRASRRAAVAFGEVAARAMGGKPCQSPAATAEATSSPAGASQRTRRSP